MICDVYDNVLEPHIAELIDMEMKEKLLGTMIIIQAKMELINIGIFFVVINNYIQSMISYYQYGKLQKENIILKKNIK